VQLQGSETVAMDSVEKGRKKGARMRVWVWAEHRSGEQRGGSWGGTRAAT